MTPSIPEPDAGVAPEEPVGQRGRGQRQGKADGDANGKGTGLGGDGEQTAPGDEGIARQGDAHDDRQRKLLRDLQQQGE